MTNHPGLDNAVAINTDEMNDKVLRGLAQEEQADWLLTRAYVLLKWCDEHEGECLADHPLFMRRLRQVLGKIGEFQTTLRDN